MAFLQMKHWAQNLGAYLFMGPPQISKNHPEDAFAWSFPSPPAGMTQTQYDWSAPAPTATIHVLDGYLCATAVDSEPRRLAWLLKLHLFIELDLAQPLMLNMDQTQVTLRMASLPNSTQLSSIYLQPPRKVYVPNASDRVQSLSPLIDGTNNELVVHGTGEFYLHASGGSAYFTDIPTANVDVTVQLPLMGDPSQNFTTTFVASDNVSPGVHIWVLPVAE